MLLSKLPDQPRDRWNREVYSIRANHSRGPELNDLINYVDKETALVSDSLFSKEAVEQYLDERDLKVDERWRVRSYAIRSEEQSKNKPDKDTKKDKCVTCTTCHDLDDCSIFMSLTVEYWIKVLFKNKLCYGCYGCISRDHSARNCKQQRSCKICKEKHPTGLHGFTPKKEGVKQDSGNGDNNQITTTCTGVQLLSCASTKFRSCHQHLCSTSADMPPRFQ